MITVEAPAKVNLALHVFPPRRDGYHPVESLVQTVDWCETLNFEEIDEARDLVEFVGAELDPEDNLVVRALATLRESIAVPPLRVEVGKGIPMGAGLGGGSSNAAATLLGASRVAGGDGSGLEGLAVRLGADVPLFLVGGTVMVFGIGEVLSSQRHLEDVCLAIAVPDFDLETSEVYRRWDVLEGPHGPVTPERSLPPSLRDGMPVRNDLLPAALDLEPRLGDFMADIRAVWGMPVHLTGSGSGCFGLFGDLDEASAAATAVAHLCSVSRGTDLRPFGVSLVDRGHDQEER